MVSRTTLAASMLLLACYSFALSPNTGIPENKDSILTVLVNNIKLRQPGIIGAGTSSEVKFQSFSYLGYIMNEDSIPNHRILLSYTTYRNDSLDIKIILFTSNEYIGYYKVKDSKPKRIMNFRYLTFDVMTKDFNGHPVPVKINFSKEIPYKFNVGKDELTFVSFVPDHLNEHYSTK